MDSCVFTTKSKDDSLPLASLRLLVPPVQLMTASLWQTLRRQDVMNYWDVAEFVSLVTDMVPELLMFKHRTQLILGLRARYIVELCRREFVDSDFILSQLDKLDSHWPDQVEAAEQQKAVVHFSELIQTLVKDQEERRDFFSEVFPVEFGADYDSDLRTLFWELLCRLAQLLPVPDIEQTVSWLRAEASVSKDCWDSVSEPEHLKTLLQHHRDRAGLLDQHVPPCSMGDTISSSLAAVLPVRVITVTERPRSPEVISAETQTGAELITVTEYAEVELATSADTEVVTGEHRHQRTDGVTVEEPSLGGPSAKAREEEVEGTLAPFTPHRRWFPFRQSLRRHRHRAGHAYSCTVAMETRCSLSADLEAGTHRCQQSCCTADESEAKSSNSPERGSEPDCGLEENVEVQGCEPMTCRSPGPVTDSYNRVKVRTSGRKRKPTMKVQVINLQKSLTTRRRKGAKVNPPTLKPQTVSSADHSYGSPLVSVKSGAETAVSPPQRPLVHSDHVQVQQQGDSRHWAQTQEDEACPQPVVDTEGRLSCPSCEKSFKFQSLLKAHQRVHTGEQPFLCSQCGRRFSFKQSLERHKQTHSSGRRYRCPICGEFFKSSLAQREHRSAHMENGEYVCSECGRGFAWKSALVRHLKIHGESPDTDGRSYRCPHCDLSFSRANQRHQHLRTHQEPPVQAEHRCNCGKSFAYQAALTAHLRIHQKERPHVCTQCGKGFLYRGGLLSHMKIHSEEMPYTCSHCGKRFKRERNMKKHERCHTREKVFSCSRCDKSFVYKATLVRHELTHTGERPYLCSDCGKRFFSHAELLKHERFHKDHKPFHCPHCGKKFTQSCYLTIHLRYHTGARPYSCTECDKSFLSANRLKRHQRTHSEDRPHLCVECGRGFRQAYNLRMHQQTHLTFS